MSRASRIFFQGLAAILPLSVSIFAVYWLGHNAESVLGGAFRKILPNAYYQPGMGVAAGIVLVFLVGLLMEFWLVRRIFGLTETLFEKIPFLKTVYGAVKDLMGFFSGGGEEKKRQSVVRVTLAPGIHALGILTRDSLADLPEGLAEEDAVAVYMPMSYQIGGHTAFVPRKLVEPVEMSVEDAMRFAVTAGMTTRKKNRPRTRPDLQPVRMPRNRCAYRSAGELV